jgi:ABC-2 type transport system permease protein
MHVLSTLLYLRITTLRNKLLGTLRRLRQPKYLFGAIAAAAYFWFFFFRHTTGRGSPNHIFAAILAPDSIEIVAALVLTLFAVLIWVTPGDNPGLAFSEAEVAFLFPAPLARRQLIHYKLLDGLLMSLVGAFFFTLIAGGLSHGWLGALRRLGAWWSLNANITLHQTAAALTIARLSQAGLTTSRRRLLLIGGIGLGLLTILMFVVQSGAASVEWLLWPARLAVRPFLAQESGTYLLSLCPAIILVAIQYFWIHRMETPFEEASISRAQKTGETIARIKSGRGIRFGGKVKARFDPFALTDRLPPEAALLWKNLMAAPAWINRKVFLAAVAVIIIGFRLLQSQTDIEGPKLATAGGFIALAMLAYLLIFGPQLLRNDLRGDLMNADLLKAYPLPGWRILLGSLLAPTLILSAVAWLFLLAAGIGLVPPAGKALWFTPAFRVSAGLSLAVLMPLLCAVQLLVPNAAALIFPAWSQTTRPMAGGMDVMGQRMIFFAGQFICLLLALLPAGLLGGLTIFLTQWLIGLTAAVALAALPVLLVFAGEVWLGVRLLGPRFDRLDISSELRN